MVGISVSAVRRPGASPGGRFFAKEVSTGMHPPEGVEDHVEEH